MGRRFIVEEVVDEKPNGCGVLIVIMLIILFFIGLGIYDSCFRDDITKQSETIKELDA